MAAAGRAALTARCPASPQAPEQRPLPPRCPPRRSRCQPRSSRACGGGIKGSSSPAGAGEMVLASPGLMFQLLWWREQIVPQKLLSHRLGFLRSEMSREYLPPEVEGQAGRAGRGIPLMPGNTGNALTEGDWMPCRTAPQKPLCPLCEERLCTKIKKDRRKH